MAFKFASAANLSDSVAAQGYRANFDYAPANQPPTVVACDGATSDVYFSGHLLSQTFQNYTLLVTNGTGLYCASAQEDSAMLEALLRGDISGRLDFSRIIVMRTASDFDEPPPNFSAYQHLFWEHQGGFDISIENLYRAGIKIIQGIVDGWDSTFEAGIQPTNYIGDVWGSRGAGLPEFGSVSLFRLRG